MKRILIRVIIHIIRNTGVETIIFHASLVRVQIVCWVLTSHSRTLCLDLTWQIDNNKYYSGLLLIFSTAGWHGVFLFLFCLAVRKEPTVIKYCALTIALLKLIKIYSILKSHNSRTYVPSPAPPVKPHRLKQYGLGAGPPSTTLDQHSASIGSTCFLSHQV